MKALTTPGHPLRCPVGIACLLALAWLIAGAVDELQNPQPACRQVVRVAQIHFRLSATQTWSSPAELVPGWDCGR